MNVVEKAFQPLRDLPCWNVRPGYGSFLTFEFGHPHLSIRDPLETITAKSLRVRRLLSRRTIAVHGQWHLWIYCSAWKVMDAGRIVGDWSENRRRRSAAAAELDGKKLIQVALGRRTGSTTFLFEFGSRLTTWPYDRDSEQWLLYEPRRMCTKFRADGFYSRGRSDADPAEALWRRP